MRKFWLFTPLFFFLIVNSSFGQAGACQSKLDNELKQALLASEDIFADLHHLSRLKMAKGLAEDEYQKDILQEQIRSKVDYLKDKDTESLEKLMLNAYRLYGKEEAKAQAEAYMEEESSKVGPAGAVRLMRALEPECALSQGLCLEELDEALFWVGREMSQSQSPLAMAEFNPLINPELYLSGEEGDDAANKIKLGIDREVSALMETFKTSQQMCGFQPAAGPTCGAKRDAGMLSGQVNEMMGVLSFQREEELLSPPPRVLDSLRAKYGWKNADVDNGRIPVGSPESMENMCGGRPFYPSLENKEIFGFSDPRGGARTAANAWKTYKRDGIKGLERMSKNNSARGGRTGGKFNGASFLGKFAIPGPIFRCEPENPIAIPKVGMLAADKKVCCDEKIRKDKVRYFFFNWGGGFSCRAFFGIPYLAEVGAKLGVGLNVILSGGWEPQMCLEKQCVKATPMFNLSGGLYAEALAGAGSIQGSISWAPYLSVQQCKSQYSDDLPPADISYQIGRVLAIVSARIGWSFTYNDIKVLYENHDTKHNSFPIF